MNTHSWFTLLYSRNEHNSAKRLHSNNKIKKKSRIVCKAGGVLSNMTCQKTLWLPMNLTGIH